MEHFYISYKFYGLSLCNSIIILIFLYYLQMIHILLVASIVIPCVIKIFLFLSVKQNYPLIQNTVSHLILYLDSGPSIR